MNMYNSDFPISTQSEDALGRASYARNLARTITKYGIADSLCIGLLGPWGCGKTSILNMMIEEIKEIDREANSLLVIRFEPWNFTSTDQLLNRNRSIIPRYRKVVVPGTHTAENHDFISPDQGSRSSISKSLRCATRSGNTLSR